VGEGEVNGRRRIISVKSEGKTITVTDFAKTEFTGNGRNETWSKRSLDVYQWSKLRREGDEREGLRMSGSAEMVRMRG
jgi:hypothetical protein